MSVSVKSCSTSIKQRKSKSADIVREKQSNSLSTADRHSQHNNSSSLNKQKNVRVTNKKTKNLSTCSDNKVHSRTHFTINSVSNKNEMVDRNISTSSKTDVNIYGTEKTTTTTTSSTNNNPNSNRIDRNSNTLPSGSSNLTRQNNNGNTKMTSSVPKQSDPTTSSSTIKSNKNNNNNKNNQEGALCDNNNVGPVVALGTSASECVTVETVKKVKKSRKDRERNSDGSKKSSRNPDSHKKRRVKVAQTDYSTIERTDAEGAASEDLVDFDNDPDDAEWANLRCTSQSTEVVQEREQRRQKRCADYPGLAFGRSVFSSDTLMKFSIIRNELHNIMKTQLKRVTFFFPHIITNYL